MEEPSEPQPHALPRSMTVGPKAESGPPSIATTYAKCLDLYRTFLVHLSDKSCRAVRLEQVDVQRVLEEYGRFRIWGEQSRAALSPLARGSLDSILRDDDQMKGLVFGILGQLERQLTLGKRLSSSRLVFRLLNVA